MLSLLLLLPALTSSKATSCMKEPLCPSSLPHKRHSCRSRDISLGALLSSSSSSSCGPRRPPGRVPPRCPPRSRRGRAPLGSGGDRAPAAAGGGLVRWGDRRGCGASPWASSASPLLPSPLPSPLFLAMVPRAAFVMPAAAARALVNPGAPASCFMSLGCASLRDIGF